MKIEAESTNNKVELLIKVIPLETHVVIGYAALLSQAFCSGTKFKKVIN